MPDMFDRQLNGVVITYFSTASAVGKTLLSINMASELARVGHTVCLLDADLQFGDVEDYLDLNPVFDLADMHQAMLENPEQSLDDYMSVYVHNNVRFTVIPSPKNLTLAYNIEPEVVGQIVKRLQSKFDFVIVDTTSMFSSLNMILLDMSTIVTFLGIVDFIPTIKNMKIGMETLRSLNYDDNKIRLVLNRSDAKTQIGIRDVEKLLGEPFYHVLPNDFQAATKSIKTGVPLVLSGVETSLTKSLRELVSLYTNRHYDVPLIQEEEFSSSEAENINNDSEDNFEEYYEGRGRRSRNNNENEGGGGWFSRLFR